ncbi:MAG: alpha-amylase family glycosyl hydrolase, partial [bacterium]
MSIKRKNFESGMRIYNLFPRLVGPIVTWSEHLPRIRNMGFNCIFLNPFHLTGQSGSLYAIKDYKKIDPHFLLDGGDGWKDLKGFIHLAKKEELRVMIDLVINHTASDSDLTRLHPEWYKHGSDGDFQHPFCVDSGNGGKITIWRDLAEIENDGEASRNGLWEFWWELVEKYMDLGIDAFRCDAAYKVPSSLWEYLIKKARRKNKSFLFLAETLGCSEEETIQTARCGFDYIYNSSKWWDLSADWCLRQYEMTRHFAGSISFPETHDTPRLCHEMQGNIDVIKMRYLLAALFSSGVMMPIGYEYGFMKPLHVVKTTPQDWEQGIFDLEDFITRCNALKDRYEIFNEEGEQYISPLSNSSVLVLKKISLDEREKVAI